MLKVSNDVSPKNVTDHRNPILLLHGIWDTGAIFNPMSAALTRQGWSVHCINLMPNDGTAGLDCLAQQVADYVDQCFSPEQPIDLVGFSMGGLVSRYYVQRLGGIHRVQRLITLGTPHQGTLTALVQRLDGYVQMRPNSIFLKDLNQDAAVLERLDFTSIWTPWDAMIVPAASSKLGVGKEVQVPVLVHSWMVTNPTVIKIVAEQLAAPMPR